VPHVTVAVLRKSTQTRGRCHRDVRKEVEAPLDIRDVIHQISCFSKTIVMNITLPCVGRTSAHDVRPLAMTFLLFLSRGCNLKHDSV